jgi:hypothetical protein
VLPYYRTILTDFLPFFDIRPFHQPQEKEIPWALQDHSPALLSLFTGERV